MSGPRAAFEVTQVVEAPSSAVWSVLADYARDGEWRAGVSMRQEPPGMAIAGAVTHERVRLLGIEMRVVARVEEVDAGRRLTFRTVESDVPVHGERRVDPVGANRSQVTVRLAMEPVGVWAWFKKPLTALFRRRFARDLQRLAALVERGSGGPPART